MSTQAMQTRCPQCQTVFRLTEDHLAAAKGLVRCSRCQQTFDAKKHLVQSNSSKENAGESDILEFKAEDFNDSEDSELPELLKEDKRKRLSWISLLFWSVLTIIFSALLAGQILWLVNRDSILQQAELRPWLERFCQHFLCQLPETRNVKKFFMREHVIHEHPTIDGAIEIQAIFDNLANFPQPYPDVQLTFSDIQGKPVAQRRFKPSEYVQNYTEKKYIKSGAAVHIKLEIIDVTENAIENYNFEFL